eukprot:NODE_771_length_4026_cov_0.732620.p2 type:complete len:228 gc:universal NODE_771_length_4026_cov_0.732620:1568-885(-)
MTPFEDKTLKMKVTRTKQMKKIISFYTFIFKLELPLRVFLHHSVISYCLEHQLDLQHLISTSIQQPIKISTLKCSKHLHIDKTVKKEMRQYLAYDCKNEVHSENCFDNLNGILCIQDYDKRKELSKTKCVPFLYFNQSTLVIEQISKLAKKNATEIDSQKRVELTEFEKNLVDNYQIDDVQHPQFNDLGYKGKMPKRREIKGANPLSCKSKQIKKKNRRKPKVNQDI